MTPRFFKTAEEQRLDIQIAFTNGSAIYTTGDVVEGVAKITAISHMRFEKINIEFVGTARTYNDCNIAAAAGSQRPEAGHRFLKLTQPDLSAYYPSDLVLRAGQTCHVPFRFTVPEKLQSGACSHSKDDISAAQQHLSLPPSLCDNDCKDLPMIADDMAPEMARIRYETTVQVVKANAEVVATKAKAVRIVPAAAREPSFNTSIESKEYIMRQEKLIRKRMSKAKCGTLVVEAVQSQATLIRSAVHSDAEQTTTIPVVLRFNPENVKCTPPDLRNLVAELQATTHFTTNVRNVLTMNEGRVTDPYQGTYSQKVKVSANNTISANWVKRGESYVANLSIPLTLPSNKTFVPTFHSCLISRVYSLSLTLNMNTAGAQTSMNLKLPFQILADRSIDRYSDAKSDLWAILEDEKEYCMELPPNCLDIKGLEKGFARVSVVEC